MCTARSTPSESRKNEVATLAAVEIINLPGFIEQNRKSNPYLAGKRFHHVGRFHHITPNTIRSADLAAEYCCSRGISSLHGGHQVAQKLTITALPRDWDSENGSPSR